MNSVAALLTVAVGIFALVQNVSGADYIHEIPSGPYAEYSGRPLVELGNNTYYFEHTLYANWAAAKQFCRNLGLFLLFVDDMDEENLIIDHLTQFGSDDYWSSGNDLAEKNRYVWESTGRQVTYSNWHSGQPNHAPGLWCDDSDNVILYKWEDGKYAWNDYPPCREFHPICKRLV